MIQSCSYITPELECHEILVHVLQLHPFNDLFIECRHLMHLFAGVRLRKLLGVPSRNVRKRHQESQQCKCSDTHRIGGLLWVPPQSDIAVGVAGPNPILLKPGLVELGQLKGKWQVALLPPIGLEL